MMLVLQQTETETRKLFRQTIGSLMLHLQHWDTPIAVIPALGYTLLRFQHLSRFILRFQHGISLLRLHKRLVLLYMQYPVVLLLLRHVVIALPGLQHPRLLAAFVSFAAIPAPLASEPLILQFQHYRLAGLVWGFLTAISKDKRIADRGINPYRLKCYLFCSMRSSIFAWFCE